jgi:mandelamide amidase
MTPVRSSARSAPARTAPVCATIARIAVVLRNSEERVMQGVERFAGALLIAAAPTAVAAAAPDIDTLGAREAVRAICTGRFTSAALVQAYLERIRARPELNAFITLDEARALRAAHSADAERKERGTCLPLDGVPIVVKDNIHVVGLPSSAGTPALKDFRPSRDAPVVRKLRAAGAIVLGKTNMHELAFGISGYNTAFGTGPEFGVRNAYDAARMAGGSSSGTGAAIGARMAPAGLGTDTGGSIRIPCAFNGCVGLRPTIGRYPQEGIAPISHTRDTAGPMARTMADIELLDRVIAGGAPVRAADLKKVRLGVVQAFHEDLDDDTRAAVDAATRRMLDAGATIVAIDMPRLAELNGAVGFPLALYEAYDDMVAYLKRYDTGVDIEQLAAAIASPDVKATYQGLVLPRKLPGPDDTVVDARPAYDAAIATARPALRQLYADTFAKHKLDALVFPTVPRVAMEANPDSSSLGNFLTFIRNTDPGSNAGIPGLTLPIGLGATSGLPVGIELDGPAGNDRRLISIGLALERLFGALPPPAR